jgi:hypothetical protein
MEYVWLKFLKEWSNFSSGEILRIEASYKPPMVNRLIRDGIAERYIPKKNIDRVKENDFLG